MLPLHPDNVRRLFLDYKETCYHCATEIGKGQICHPVFFTIQEDKQITVYDAFLKKEKYKSGYLCCGCIDIYYTQEV